MAAEVELREDGTPFVPLAIGAYVVHDPVSVLELRGTAFAGHPILTMARRTAYPCTPERFEAAAELVRRHGPTPAPRRPGRRLNRSW